MSYHFNNQSSLDIEEEDETAAVNIAARMTDDELVEDEEFQYLVANSEEQPDLFI
jgi:hypothetical protein